MSITLGQLKEYVDKALEKAPADTPVSILFETGFCQYQYYANGCIFPDTHMKTFILSYELDLLPRHEWQMRWKDGYKMITRVLKKIDREDVGRELEAFAAKEVDDFFGPPATTHELDVHTEHCCSQHGCKYSDEDCTVTSGQKTQSHPCMDCQELV